MIREFFNGQLPKAVLFDLDGTLVDSVPDLACAIDNMLVDLHFLEAGEAKVRLWVGNGARSLVQRALANAIGCDEKDVDMQLLDKAHQLFLLHYDKNPSVKTKTYPFVLEVLQQLHTLGVKLAVITNKPQQFTPAVLKACGIADYFSCVLSGDSLPVKKPDPAPLLLALEQLGSSLSECLMVGDSASDIIAAQAAGMTSICVTYGYNHGENPYELPASAHIACFSELLR